MTTDQPATGHESGRPLRTDGGSSMPGVPSEESVADTDDEPEPTTAGGGSASSGSQTTTSSGSQMPGVPDSKGPEPAVQSGGGDSCEAPEHDADDGETHDLTTAFTLGALASTRDPASVVQDARSWSDWVGVVGAADAPTINTFIRRNNVDVDFFNGANDPQTRLARVASDASTFYSDRLVLIGVEDESDFVPGEEWEFEPLEPTAEEAGWTLK